MLNKIIGLVLLLISAGLYGYWYLNPEVTANWLFWIKVSVSGLSGLGVLGYEFIPMIGVSEKKTIKRELSPSELEQKDFEALTYLKKRMNTIGSNEGLDTLKDLNRILFSRDLAYISETKSE
jgi:hypothetical protein